MKRVFIWIIAFIAVGFLITGCTGKNSTSSGGNGTPSTAQASSNIQVINETTPIGDGERWADHDFTTFVPKPNKPLGDVISLDGDDYFYVGIKFDSKTDFDAYIAQAKENGFVEEADRGNEWLGTKSISIDGYKSVDIVVEFSEMFGNGSIRIYLMKSPIY